MHNRDPHQALKTEVVKQSSSRGAGLQLARLHWGKDDLAYSCHVTPTSFSLSGLQQTDFLGYLGFRHSTCAFSNSGQCYVRWVSADFDLDGFAKRFDTGFDLLVAAQQHLQACGLTLDQPEGWAFYTGGRRGSRTHDWDMSGDGHTATTQRQMKTAEDAVFNFAFTFIDTGREKGWVTHIRPKHHPLSAELETVLEFLKLKRSHSCAEFDFDPCYWRSTAYVDNDRDPFSGRANVVHGWFDSLANNLSPGIEKLLSANREVEQFGLGFLKAAPKAQRLTADIQKKVQRGGAPEKKSAVTSVTNRSTSAAAKFDIAISFAGTERECARTLADRVQAAGYSVFFDDFYPEYLWGKDLIETFDEIYRKQARFCVMFVSKEYAERIWTIHERKSAQARALSEKGSEYILPIRVDNTELPGMPGTVGYLPLTTGIDTIADILIKKLKR